MDTPMPPAEVRVTAETVRELISEQCPGFADQKVHSFDEGWDNVTFRVGDAFAARLPRREAAVDLLRHEQKWLPHLAVDLGVPVPVPVHAGKPSEHYPWPWSIVPWIPGVPADEAALDPSEGTRVGRALRSLHRPAPSDAPTNPFRGVPLRERGERTHLGLDRLEEQGESVDRLRRIWSDGVEADRHEIDRWLHGDLHPRNLIVADGRLSGIIDWGDLCRGDPATDLSVAWTLFSPEGRGGFWEGYGPVDAHVLRRARAWAVFFGVALATTDEERHRDMGVGIIESLLH